MNGMFLQLSQKRSYFVELRSQWCGFGIVRYEKDQEWFLGLLQVTVSSTRSQPPPARRSLRPLATAVAILLALLVPTDDVLVAASEWYQTTVNPPR